MPPYRRRWLLVGVFTLQLPAAALAQSESPPCKAALAEGFIELRRVSYPRALQLFEQARQGAPCVAEAQVGLADTFNRMNDHKKALVAARWVLQNTGEQKLLAEASYQIGLALNKKGSRKTKQKLQAQEAFRQAVELSQGEHEAAIRALMRLCRDTRQDDELAALEQRFPEVRTLNREQQKLVASRGRSVCGPGKAGDWKLELPSFEPGEEADEPGNRAPRKKSTRAPHYNEEDRRERIQGVVRFEARVDVEGRVDRVRILQELSPGLDDAALEAVCGWLYEPATTPDGKPTACYVEDEVRFEL